jgi:hypothetical protein
VAEELPGFESSTGCVGLATDPAVTRTVAFTHGQPGNGHQAGFRRHL